MRLPVAGLGLLISSAVLMALPIFWFPIGSHPLSGYERFNLCGAIENGPLAALPYELASRKEPGAQESPGPQCLLEFSSPGLGDTRYVQLEVTLLTQSGLNGFGPHVDTGKYWQRFVDESRAGGSEVESQSGPWRDAALLHQLDGELWLLAEDHGIVIWLRTYDLQREELLAFASALAPRLREAPVDD